MKPLGVAEERVGEKPTREKGFDPLWILAAGLVVILLAVLALAGILISQQMGEKGTTVPSTSSGEQKTTTAGTIEVPGGPTIKVVFTGPSELKASWSKLGMEGFQLKLVGTLKNASNQSIKFSEIAFLIDGNQVDFLWGKTLAPGEEMPIARGLVGYSETTKQLVVKVKGVERIDSSVNEPESGPAKIPADYPTTPEGVVERFYNLLIAGKYTEAFRLLLPEGELSREFKWPDGMRTSWEKEGGKNIIKVEILGHGRVTPPGSSRTPVFGVIYFKDGTKEVYPNDNRPLIYVEMKNGVWYIEG